MATGDEGQPSDNNSAVKTGGSFQGPEMSACPKCSRLNPKTRFECLYCGQMLATEPDIEAPRITLKKPEIWEEALNVIFIGASGASNLSAISAAVSVFGIDSNLVRLALENAIALPLCRVNRLEEADFIRSRLETAGATVCVIEDRRLNQDKPPVRIRSARFTETALLLEDFNTGRIAQILFDERVAVVSGRLVTSQSEHRSRRKDDEKRRESITITVDTPLLDIYRQGDPSGFRIRADGFDFSGIGNSAGLIAETNLKILTEMLVERLAAASFDNNYEKVRNELSEIWPLEVNNSSRGIYRTGLGTGFAAGETTNNANQFTRYSRMMYFYNNAL